MDMTLYAMLMNSLQEQTECKLWNGYRIEIVDVIPETQNHNTIYFVKSDIEVGEVVYLNNEAEEVEESEAPTE